MNTKLPIIALSSMALTSAWMSAQEWTPIEDFSSVDDWFAYNHNASCEGEDPESCYRVQEVVSDPAGGGGTVGLFRAAPLNQEQNWGPIALRELETPILSDYTGTFTVYYEFAVESLSQDTVFGLSALDSSGLVPGLVVYGSYATALRISTLNAGLLQIRDEEVGEYVTVSNDAVQSNTWYKVWMVHHNDSDFQGNPDAQTYDVYIEGGEWTEQSLVYEGAWYRNTEANIRSFQVTQATGASASTLYGNSALFLRNLQIDYGGVNGGTDAENLTEPGGDACPNGDWAGYCLDANGWAETPHFGWVAPVGDTGWLQSGAFAQFIYSPEAASTGTNSAWFYLINSNPSSGAGGANTWAGYPVDENGWADTGSYAGFLNVGTGSFSGWAYSYSLQNWVYTSEAGSTATNGSWFYAIKANN